MTMIGFSPEAFPVNFSLWLLSQLRIIWLPSTTKSLLCHDVFLLTVITPKLHVLFPSVSLWQKQQERFFWAVFSEEFCKAKKGRHGKPTISMTAGVRNRGCLHQAGQGKANEERLGDLTIPLKGLPQWPTTAYLKVPQVSSYTARSLGAIT